MPIGLEIFALMNGRQRCCQERKEEVMVIAVESGMVQWLSFEACDREIRFRFPALAVISDLVVVCYSS